MFVVFSPGERKISSGMFRICRSYVEEGDRRGIPGKEEALPHEVSFLGRKYLKRVGFRTVTTTPHTNAFANIVRLIFL